MSRPYTPERHAVLAAKIVQQHGPGGPNVLDVLKACHAACKAAHTLRVRTARVGGTTGDYSRVDAWAKKAQAHVQQQFDQIDALGKGMVVISLERGDPRGRLGAMFIYRRHHPTIEGLGVYPITGDTWGGNDATHWLA